MSAGTKTLTLTSRQLEDVRIALVEQRGHLMHLEKFAFSDASRSILCSQVSRIDVLLLLLAKA